MSGKILISLQDSDRKEISTYFKTDPCIVEFYKVYQNLVLKIGPRKFNIKKEKETKGSEPFTSEEIQFLRKMSSKLIQTTFNNTITASDFLDF